MTNWYLANRERAKARARSWQLSNRDRAAALRKAWGEAHPERVQALTNEARWRRLGLKGATQDCYNDLLMLQEGRCGICRAPDKKLVWNHDRLSGQPRGLLCQSCHMRLVWLEKLFDDTGWFEAAQPYLTQWEVTK